MLHFITKTALLVCCVSHQQLLLQSGPDMWLVFHDEGTSLHSLMYSPATIPPLQMDNPPSTEQDVTPSQQRSDREHPQKSRAEQGGGKPADGPSTAEDASKNAQVRHQ